MSDAEDDAARDDDALAMLGRAARDRILHSSGEDSEGVAAEMADHEASGEDSEGEEEEPAAAEAKRRRKASTEFGKNYRKSKPRKEGKDPERAAARRAQRVMKEIHRLLNLRADVKIDVINRLLIKLTKAERAELRGMGAMMQEQYIAVREAVTRMEKENFNAINSIDIRSTEALAIRPMMAIRERLACDAEGKRIVLIKPPHYQGKNNPLTRKSNRDQGIYYEHKNICVPYVFRNPKQIAAALSTVLDGHTLQLSYDFDAAAWDMWDMARNLLLQLEHDKNLLELPAGTLRVLQLIFDGHGWLSRCGAVRFTLRCVDTIEDHNSTRNARDPIFALGTDKCADVARCVKVGGAKSMEARMYQGLVITEAAVADMPAHVQNDKDFLPLARIRWGGSCPCLDIVCTFLKIYNYVCLQKPCLSHAHGKKPHKMKSTTLTVAPFTSTPPRRAWRPAAWRPATRSRARAGRIARG